MFGQVLSCRTATSDLLRLLMAEFVLRLTHLAEPLLAAAGLEAVRLLRSTRFWPGWPMPLRPRWPLWPSSVKDLLLISCRGSSPSRAQISAIQQPQRQGVRRNGLPSASLHFSNPRPCSQVQTGRVQQLQHHCQALGLVYQHQARARVQLHIRHLPKGLCRYHPVQPLQGR